MGNNDGKVIIQVDTNAAKAAQDFKQLDNEIKNLNRDTQQTKTQTNNVSSGFSGASSALFSLKGAAIAAAGAFVAMKLTQFAGDIFKISSAFEQLNVAFEVLAGQSAGQQLVKDLTDLANVTPMTTQGLADNSRLLLSFGEASQNVIADLKLLGDISGGNQQKMDSLALAFAQAGAAGKLMGQDLLQMVNAGFNPLQAISEKTGKSMGELRKEMEKGNISFSMMKQAMIDATSEGGRFYGMMNKQSQTLEGRLSTLADKWGLVAKGIGDFFLPVAKSAVNILIKMGDGVLYLQSQLAKLDHPIQRASIGLQKLFGMQKQSSLVFTMKTDVPEKAQSASNAINKMQSGFRDSSMSAEKHAKKIKEADSAYDLFQKRIAKTTEELQVMALKGQAGTAVFEAKKRTLEGYKTTLENINKAIETQAVISPYDKLQKDLEKATMAMRDLAAQGKVDLPAFKSAKDNATALSQQLEKINQTLVLTPTSPYDQLSNNIAKMKSDLENLAVSGQAGTPAFDKLKNDYVEATNQMKDANRQVTNAMGLDWENISSSIKTDLASAITTPLSEGETAFQRMGNVALNIISMIGQKMVEQLLEEISLTQVLNGVKAIGKALSFGLFANGDVFSGGKPQAFASGGVVSSPTLFPMANGGTGLMGEAGAEAIMPLKRGSNGKLGVQASGSGGNVYVNNYSNAQIETTKRPNGDTEIRIREINNALANERTQQGLSVGMSRQNSRGVTAA